jgi:hypothetical protein
VRGPSGWARTAAAVALALGGVVGVARAQEIGAANREGTVVSGVVGSVHFGQGGVTLVGLDVTSLKYGGLAGRGSLSTWLEAVRAGHVLIDFEAGPSFAVPLGTVAAVTGYGGLDVLLALAGPQVGTGFGGHVGAAGMVAMSPNVWFRLSLSHRWYKGPENVSQATAFTIGLGVRIR